MGLNPTTKKLVLLQFSLKPIVPYFLALFWLAPIVSFDYRMLVYEYVNNGNLEQWLHGAMRHHGALTWEARMKIILGTAKA